MVQGFDEVDKFPAYTGKEAGPQSLAKERTKTFSYNKKIFQTSTPTRRSGPIWQAWESADRQMYYYVPCPHCGYYQTLRFGQLRGIKDKTPDEARAAAYYECEQCKGVITDSQKPSMLMAGRWQAEKDTGTLRTAFHLNALYSPWVRFGDMAYEFKKSKDYPDLLMNFVNSWLAEPWKNTETEMNANKVLERQSGYFEGVVPDGAILLTGGVDVQKNYFYFTVRAWGTSMTSWNIAHGIAETWDDVERIMNLPYKDEHGNTYQVNLCAIDSGANTEEVYDFCVINQEWAIPVKGSSNPLLSRYRISTIDKIDSKAYGMRLYLVDGAQYKDMIAGRLNRQNGPGSWMVFQECDRDYAEQICAEEKVIEKKGERQVEVWRPKSSHAANHYLDAEVYAALAADLLHVRYMQTDEREEPPKPVQPVQAPAQDDFLKTNGSWISQKGGWLR